MLIHFISKMTSFMIVKMAIMKFAGHNFQIHGAVFDEVFFKTTLNKISKANINH